MQYLIYSYFFLFWHVLAVMSSPSCPHVLSANTNIDQPLFGSALLGSARLGSVEICSSKRATSSAFLPCALLEGEGRRERGKGRRDGYTTARDGAAFVRRESDLSLF